jgi:hypothetical protein
LKFGFTVADKIRPACLCNASISLVSKVITARFTQESSFVVDRTALLADGIRIDLLESFSLL